MSIHQLSVHHDERQDRLLLRLNTEDLHEYRFWLTRRMTLRIMPAIEQSAARLEAAQPGVAVPDAPAQKMLSELKRDAFLEKADFVTPFENRATQWPLGPEPMLITETHLTIKPGGSLEITFEDKSNTENVKSCQLHLQLNLVHGLLLLIHQARDKAEWLNRHSTDEGAEKDTLPAQATPHRYAH